MAAALAAAPVDDEPLSAETKAILEAPREPAISHEEAKAMLLADDDVAADPDPRCTP